MKVLRRRASLSVLNPRMAAAVLGSMVHCCYRSETQKRRDSDGEYLFLDLRTRFAVAEVLVQASVVENYRSDLETMTTGSHPSRRFAVALTRDSTDHRSELAVSQARQCSALEYRSAIATAENSDLAQYPAEQKDSATELASFAVGQ